MSRLSVSAFGLVGMVGLLVSASMGPPEGEAAKAQGQAVHQAERHLQNIRQLTGGRQNTQPFFSLSGDKLIFQSTNNWMQETYAATLAPGNVGLGCPQTYAMDLGGKTVRLVSTGIGATTSGSFFPGDRRVVYASTHAAGPNCPLIPTGSSPSRGVLADYDLYAVRLDGQEMQRLTATSGYDAEATVSPDGTTIVWTSVKEGDLDLYAMNLDGSRPRRLTHTLGYEGGAKFSPDSQRIVYHGSHPLGVPEVATYTALRTQGLVERDRQEIFVMQADGSGQRQVTSNGASNFAPAYFPDGQTLIFASTASPQTGLPPRVHLYAIGEDGHGLEQLTFAGQFNSFPMFSGNGKHLVWVSDRQAQTPGELNVFLADWVP